MNDEEFLTNDFDPAELEKELWPVPPEDIREFEDYLLDIGLRF